MAKIKMTLTYEYTGDAKTNGQIVAEERESFLNGAVCVCDVMNACEGTADLSVEVVEDHTHFSGASGGAIAAK